MIRGALQEFSSGIQDEAIRNHNGPVAVNASLIVLFLRQVSVSLGQQVLSPRIGCSLPGRSIHLHDDKR